ncbi:MAG: GNAT family N-acetyltransferase [Candidatus Eisenbacteria bacterium]|nr:GNAT family N-acetyltransferase [Candidatus Latescibacterota bacterium]MBD3303012.1 GNAT family N-acetyltransferase [Candidatus Eisenbacteria bacterium]
MTNPFLIGERVLLRPIEESDAETYARWINNPEIRRYLLVRFPMSVREEKKWIESLSDGGTRRDVALAIERKNDQKHIGSVGLHEIDWIHRRAMTGSFICPPSLRGKGYGTEAKKLLLDYAFGELGLRSLYAFALEGSEASMRALEKQGYRRGGVFRKAHLVKGEWVDGIYYDILLEDWEALRSEEAAARPGKKTQKTKAAPRRKGTAK